MLIDPEIPGEQDAQEGVIQSIVLDSTKIELIRGMLDQADHYLQSVRHLLIEENFRDKAGQLPEVDAGDEQKFIEGVFNGQAMLGQDGRTYPVPPNYASKSKLVAGDVLKLTISPDGTFVFKQIGPVERQKLIATLRQESGRLFAAVDNRHYNLLTAAVTYYRAKPGDRLTIVVPKDTPADWAAIENVVDQA